mgnify:FL=1
MRSADYEVVIDGELDRSLATAFHPHCVRSACGRTTIVGQRLDQAALLAILGTAAELALTVVRVERIDPKSGPTTGCRPPTDRRSKP